LVIPGNKQAKTPGCAARVVADPGLARCFRNVIACGGTGRLDLVYVFGMGRHEVGRAPANDPLMTVVVCLLLLLAALVCVLSGM